MKPAVPSARSSATAGPRPIHDDVLARLLDLNRQRALEEGNWILPSGSSHRGCEPEEGRKEVCTEETERHLNPDDVRHG